MIEKDLESIFDLQDVDGEVDVDGVLAAFERLNAEASSDDLPLLLKAIQSPRNNSWTRELLSEPIARLGGSTVLKPLFAAYSANVEDGHDNDSFSVFLIEIAESETERCVAECNRLLAQPSFKHGDLAIWLLTFTENRAQQGGDGQARSRSESIDLRDSKP